MTITRPQADLLAALARTIRPAWDHLATMRVLADVADRDLDVAAVAVVRAASDPGARTPKAILFADYWPDLARLDAARDSARARHSSIAIRNRAIAACRLCDDRGYLDGRVCRHDPQVWERLARGRALVDQALNPKENR